MARTPVGRRVLALASTMLLTGSLAGCGNTDSWVEPIAARGWSAQYADAANSSYSPTDGAGTLSLSWSRSVKGELERLQETFLALLVDATHKASETTHAASETQSHRE